MYPIDTPQQLRTVLRALRQSRKLTQEELGHRIGVSQKRIARIEAAPESTRFDQIARLVSAMGAHLVLDDGRALQVSEPPATYDAKDTW